LVFGEFSHPGNPQKASVTDTKAFCGKRRKGPKLPHYEEEKLKSPYLDNRF
jgi:hypothetical protein